MFDPELGFLYIEVKKNTSVRMFNKKTFDINNIRILFLHLFIFIGVTFVLMLHLQELIHSIKSLYEKRVSFHLTKQGFDF